MSQVLCRISTLKKTVDRSSSSSSNSVRLQMSQNTANISSENSKNSSFFFNVHSVKGCSFQIFNGSVNFNTQEKRRRAIIERDDEDGKLLKCLHDYVVYL